MNVYCSYRYFNEEREEMNSRPYAEVWEYDDNIIPDCNVLAGLQFPGHGRYTLLGQVFIL